jgi:cell division protein FtsX
MSGDPMTHSRQSALDAAVVHSREAWRLFSRRPIASLGTATAICLSLILTAFVAWFLGRSADLIDAIDADLELHAALDPSLDESSTHRTLLAIGEIEGVRSVRWIGPKEQRQALLDTLGPDLLEGLDDGVFPEGGMAKIALHRDALTSEEDVTSLTSKIATIAGISGVTALPYDASHIQVLFRGAAFTRLAGTLIALFALLVALLATFLVVKDALRSNRPLLMLLSAFGATSTFTRTRFILFSTVVGLLGGAAALTFGIALEEPLTGFIALLPHGGSEPARGLFGLGFVSWCLLGGPLLGLVGGLVALTRHRGDGP